MLANLAAFRPLTRAPSIPGVVEQAQRLTDATQAGPSHTKLIGQLGKVIHKTPPQNSVRIGSHYTHAGHDASFVENGILPTYGENFGGELEHGEGFYLTTESDGARWGSDPQKRGHDLRQWDVYIDRRALPKLVGLKASDMPSDHKWRPLPYAGDSELRKYIDDYDYIVDEYPQQTKKQVIQDIKFNPRALDHLYLVPNGFYDELAKSSTSPAAPSHRHSNPARREATTHHAAEDVLYLHRPNDAARADESDDESARYAAAWTEYEINKKRRRY